MSDLRLRAVLRTQGHTAALKSGEVGIPGVELEFEEVPVLVHAFRRMVRETAYDVCELSATTYLAAKEAGAPYTALPLFVQRGFHHGAVRRHIDTAVRLPGDLRGARVGVNRGYTVTTGVWARGILQEQYGLDPATVTWVLSGDEHVESFRPPSNVVPAPAGADLTELLRRGDLVATVGVDTDDEDIVPVIPNATEAGLARLRTHGHHPVNHLVVVRDELLAEHPGLAAELCAAFTAAKQPYLDALPTLADPTPADVLRRRVAEIVGRDPLPYGLEPNRRVLDELIGHARRQGILTRTPDVRELFAAGTHELAG